jgi:hypothetical protein
MWNYTTGAARSSVAVAADGKVYIGSDDKVYCLNSTTGAFIWSYTTGDIVRSSPAVFDGKVYIGSHDGNVYCFGTAQTPTPTPSPSPSPTPPPPAPYRGISDFDVLFKQNNAHVIYPSDQEPKPLNLALAMLSDWTASAFISTKLENATEGLDNNSTFVNQATGKPAGAAGTGIVSFGGPRVNPIVAYAESSATPSWNRAPIRYFSDAGVLYFQHANGTAISGANLSSSAIGPRGPNIMDVFVIEVYQDGDGRFMMLCYGFGWKGTYAAGKYFDKEIYPNLNSHPYSWIIVKWEDANGNGFVNTATDGDTYTVIATG